MNDLIQTFILGRTGFRGRIVRLGPVMQEILTAHGYPEPVGRMTAEAGLLSVLLSSMLKYKGVFILQGQGDGPVSTVVADMESGGGLRACATIREGAVISPGADAAALLGKGYLAFTVDQGPQTERYQGIVELKQGNLAESVRNYFRQSEQIGTGVKAAVIMSGGVCQAGGILIQHVPDEGGHSQTASGEEDDWRRTMVLLESCTEAELTDPALGPEDLLYRLFHEEEVRVYPPLALHKACRCSQERLAGILSGMAAEDRAEMTKDGAITMTCQFCSRDFVFDPANL